MPRRETSLTPAHGVPFGLTLHSLDQSPRPTILICHGFKGFREWGFFPWLAEQLAQAGWTAVRMDFSHNGVTPENPHEFTRLDLFEANTYARELADLDAALRWLSTQPESAPGDVTVLGHSRGAATCLQAACSLRDPRVSGVVSWAGLSSVHVVPEVMIPEWRRHGYLPIFNTRTKQELRMGLGLLEDVEAHPERTDLLARAAESPLPILAVHGDQDSSVPVAHAERLAAANPHSVTLRIVPGADHTFGAVHPFAGPTPHLEQALAVTLDWLRTSPRG